MSKIDFNSQQFIKEFLSYLKAHCFASEMDEFNEFAVVAGKKNIEDYFLDTFRESTNYIRKETNEGRGKDVSMIRAIYQSDTINEARKRLANERPESRDRLSDVYGRMVHRLFSFIETTKIINSEAKFFICYQLLSTYQYQIINSNSSVEEAYFSDFGNILRRVARLTDKYYKEYQKTKVHYWPDNLRDGLNKVRKTLEDHKYIEEAKEFISTSNRHDFVSPGQSKFHGLFYGDKSFVKWRGKSTELLAFMYFLYDDKAYKGEFIYEIIPKLFIDKKNRLFDRDQLRRSFSNISYYFENHPPKSSPPSHIQRIKTLLQESLGK